MDYFQLNPKQHLYISTKISFCFHNYFSLVSTQFVYKHLEYMQLTLMLVNSNYPFPLDIRVSRPSSLLSYTICLPCTQLIASASMCLGTVMQSSLSLGHWTYSFGLCVFSSKQYVAQLLYTSLISIYAQSLISGYYMTPSQTATGSLYLFVQCISHTKPFPTLSCILVPFLYNFP